MTEKERQGVKCIQALLALHNEWESEERSLAEWRKMSEEDKQATLDAYQFFCVGGNA